MQRCGLQRSSSFPQPHNQSRFLHVEQFRHDAAVVHLVGVRVMKLPLESNSFGLLVPLRVCSASSFISGILNLGVTGRLPSAGRTESTWQL